MNPESTKIDTSKYKKEGRVEVDGMMWTVKLPGAATELKLSKAQRRIAFLDKKIESGNYSEDDLDKYDELEDFYFSLFANIFKDATNDNSEVKAWLENTPLAYIQRAFEEIKASASKGDPVSV